MWEIIWRTDLTIRILGCGNPLVGDDGIGIHIIDKLPKDSFENPVLPALNMSQILVIDYVLEFVMAVKFHYPFLIFGMLIKIKNSGG